MINNHINYTYHFLIIPNNVPCLSSGFYLFTSDLVVGWSLMMGCGTGELESICRSNGAGFLFLEAFIS
jgi:hypothetical protein